MLAVECLYDSLSFLNLLIYLFILRDCESRWEGVKEEGQKEF